MPTRETLLDLAYAIQRVHVRLRDAILERCRTSSSDELARVASVDGLGDVTFEIDIAAESLLAAALQDEVGLLGLSLAAIFEGQRHGPLVVPANTVSASTMAADAEFLSIWDPLDGSRSLAYQTSSAWILTAIAPNIPVARLSDTLIAVQTEVPLLNQRAGAMLLAVKGSPLVAEMEDVDSGVRNVFSLRASTATTIEGGFTGNECYFEGPGELLAGLEEDIVHRVLGVGPRGAARVFKHTQLTSAGTFYSLLAGKLRWAHDFRPLVKAAMQQRGRAMSLCCHPYDMCTALLLAEALGVVLSDPRGQAFDAPLDLETDVAWVAYANPAIRDQVAPHVSAAIAAMNEVT